MERTPNSPSFLKTHFVDIHEVLPEEEEEDDDDDEEEKKGTNRKVDKADKRLNRSIKVRDPKRPHRGLNRQVSLETGFSVLLNRESKAKDERRGLSRSGGSFGGFDSANRIGLEGRKADFSMFKTKTSLSRQNSLLPSRREREVLEPQRTDHPSAGLDESVNQSVPAGRYFAALKGPELDEVKVTHSLIFAWLKLVKYSIKMIR